MRLIHRACAISVVIALSGYYFSSVARAEEVAPPLSSLTSQPSSRYRTEVVSIQPAHNLSQLETIWNNARSQGSLRPAVTGPATNPLPPTCQNAENADNATAISRFDSCSAYSEIIETNEVVDGVNEPIGEIAVFVVNYAAWVVSSRSFSIVQEYSLEEETGADVGQPVTVYGGNACQPSSFCNVTTAPDYENSVPYYPEADLEGASVTSPGTATVLGYIENVNQFVVYGAPDEPYYTNSSLIRCDSQAGNYYASGCVDPYYVPLYILSSAQYPHVANTVAPYLATHPNGNYLNRVSSAQATINRNIACAGFVPNPSVPNGSCDEYPFASSAQGGAGANTNTVPLSENQSQGADLGNFYRVNRVIYGDEYEVQVI